MDGWMDGCMDGWMDGLTDWIDLRTQMYSVKGYFDVALRSDIFAPQKHTSFFVLNNEHWLVFGLDSAFASDKKSLFMDGKLNKQQKDFLTAVRHWPGNEHKRIIILTHHDPIDLVGSKFTALYNEVVGALMCEPDYWYMATPMCSLSLCVCVC
jgi:hypothetical protein